MKKNLPERIWDRITKGDPALCWPWTAKVWKGNKGYPRVRVNGTMDYAYRVAFTLVNGPIPEGKLIMHLCNNPLCCNPSHLRLGTHRENRAHWSQSRVGLTPEKITLIKELYSVGDLTQTQVGRIVGVDQTTVSNVVRGKRDHVTAI